MGDIMRAYVPQHTMPWCMCSSLLLMRLPPGNTNSGCIRGVATGKG